MDQLLDPLAGVHRVWNGERVSLRDYSLRPDFVQPGDADGVGERVDDARVRRKRAFLRAPLPG